MPEPKVTAQHLEHDAYLYFRSLSVRSPSAKQAWSLSRTMSLGQVLENTEIRSSGQPSATARSRRAYCRSMCSTVISASPVRRRLLCGQKGRQGLRGPRQEVPQKLKPYTNRSCPTAGRSKFSSPGCWSRYGINCIRLESAARRNLAERPVLELMRAKAIVRSMNCRTGSLFAKE
jgi:hypothetical protein